MKIKLQTLFITLVLANSAIEAKEKDTNPAVFDEHLNVSLGTEEIKQAFKLLPRGKKQLALEDDDAVIGIVRQLVENKNISQAFDKIVTPENPELYWKYQFALRGLKAKLYVESYKATVQVPDMNTLALETYKSSGSYFMSDPEVRQSSHIFIACTKHSCDDKAKKKLAEEALAKLNKGEKFVALVSQYSEDPKTKDNNGQLSEWYRLGHPRVDRDYIIALFKLKKAGDVSEIIRTKFGYHIIRLDDIREEQIKSYSEVKPEIIRRLTSQYKQLAFYKRQRELQMSKDVEFSIEDLRNIVKENALEETSKTK